MDVSQPGDEKRRPYPPTANVLAVLHRARSRNLPPVIDDQFLSVLNIHPVAFGRVKEALQFLGFTEDQGRPTDTLKALAAAPEDTYRELLASAVRDAYREDFERVNPVEDTQAQIIASFQPYQPRSQTKRMVTLFLGLCREAGIPVLDAPRERNVVAARASGRGRRSSKANAQVVKEEDRLPSRDHPLVSVRQSSLLFGVSEEDIAALDETEFHEVWNALGKVARARARSRAPAVPDTDENGDSTKEVSE